MSRAAVVAIAALGLAACGSLPPTADPASDAPEIRVRAGPVPEAPSYTQALQRWRGAADVNAWIAERFEYDRARALQLSETQRGRGTRLPIHEPAQFHAAPQGVCVDLARFAVETLRVLDAASRPRYLMIEFDPVSIGGNLLRRHWVAVYEEAGALHVFADSKRPGHVAGPYADVSEFIAEYARYRDRRIVAFREMESYERRQRAAARRQARDEGAPLP